MRTYIPYNELKEGTNVRGELIKSRNYNVSLNLIYAAGSGIISKRRIQVIQISESHFQAYCYLRKSNRTFKIDNVLALIPVIQFENMVI